MKNTGKLILALLFLAFSTPQFSYLMDEGDVPYRGGSCVCKRNAPPREEQHEVPKRRCSDPDFAINTIFERNRLVNLLYFVRHKQVPVLEGFSECSSCKLSRYRMARDFFETHLLDMLKSCEFFTKLSGSLTLHITDFASGELFQIFVLVRKLIERALLLLNLSDDRKLNVIVDIIDPMYSGDDEYGNRIGISDVIQRFQNYFVYFYSKRSKINFVLNVFSDGDDYNVQVGGAHLVVCADFERAPCAIEQSNEIKLPEEFIKKLSHLLPEGECFWFSSLSKNGFKRIITESVIDCCVCVFSFKCIARLTNDTEFMMQVVPFKKGERLRGRIFACIPCPEERQFVSWRLNRGRI
jgi:hypothetical protein